MRTPTRGTSRRTGGFAEEWKRFSEERLRARFTRPKCC